MPQPARENLVPYPFTCREKFPKRGNKDGAVQAFYQLEAEGLGRIMEVGGSKGQQWYV